MRKIIPFFSIIIPTYNRKNFLKTALDSVLAQDFIDFETIIIDDGSSDGTHEVLLQYSNPHIVYKFQKNQGVASARNHGIRIAKGCFIAFLDSDDKWEPQKLSQTFEYIQKSPTIKIFHTKELWFRAGKLLKQKKKHKNPTGFVYPDILPLCCISISTAAIKKDVFDTIGAFDEMLPACEDYDLWLRITHQYEIKLIPQALTIKDGGRSDQLSAQSCLDEYRIRALTKILQSNTLSKEHYTLTLSELEKKLRIFIAGAQKRKRTTKVKSLQNLLQDLSTKMTFRCF